MSFLFALTHLYLDEQQETSFIKPIYRIKDFFHCSNMQSFSVICFVAAEAIIAHERQNFVGVYAHSIQTGSEMVPDDLFRSLSKPLISHFFLLYYGKILMPKK